MAQAAELVGIAQFVGIDDLVGDGAVGAIDGVLVRPAARLHAGAPGPSGIVVAGAGHHLAVGIGVAVLLGIAVGAVGRRAVHRRLRAGAVAFALALVVALGLLALALIVVARRIVEFAEIEIEILDQATRRSRVGILV